MIKEQEFLKKELNVSRETIEKLKIFHDTLIKWNKIHNLIGESTSSEIWHRHILDSAQLIKYISDDTSQKIVDFGSGAGFPGLVIAIIKDIPVVLIEANEKKCFFLKEIQRKLNLKVDICASRIENIPDLKSDLITARALDELESLLSYASYHLKTNGKCLFLKGKEVGDEIENAQKKWHFNLLRHQSLVDKKSYVLEIKDIIKIET